MCEIGVVVIGRNEGNRLLQCLASVVGRGCTVVYVDSGSTDGSVELARSLGAEVVELDMAALFTAARARNAGVKCLLRVDPGVQFIQFVDGDCEVVEGWLDRARRELDCHADWAAVCGWLRERFPERSIYNRLANFEWNTPVGEVKACGGIVMMRAAAFRQVGGFNPSIIAGEEPELCVRLRRQGWKVVRLDVEMTVHDMAMTRLGEWWKRSVRTGHAYAEGAAMHGRPPERHWVRETRSIGFWGILVPLATAGLAWPTRGASLALLAGYPLLFHRIDRRTRGQGASARDAKLYAFFCVLRKFPQAIGLMRYWVGRLAGKCSTLIEYKDMGQIGREMQHTD